MATRLQVIAEKTLAGVWGAEEDYTGIKVALLADIASSLRDIRNILRCDNVRRMAISAQSIDKMIREHLKSKKARKKKTVARA